jgi:cytochrome c
MKRCWLSLLIFSLSCLQAQPLAPGLQLALYELGQTPRSLPELLPGQLPSRLLTCKALDLAQSGRRQDFAPDSGAFLTQVSGFLRIAQPGSYRFRLSANDAARLSIGGRLLLEKDTSFGDSGGVFFLDTELELPAGDHALRIEHVNIAGPALLRLEWYIEGLGQYLPLPAEVLYHDSVAAPAFQPGLKRIYSPAARHVPGNGAPLAGLHPAFDRCSLAPADRKPRVSGMAFRSDGLLYYCSPDLPGEIWALEGGQGEGAAASARRFATGLNEPMGLAVVDDTLYVLQRQEITQVLDRNGDGQADEFRTLAIWPAALAGGEGASGLAYRDGYFCAAVSGRLLRVARGGETETMARPGAAWSLGAGAEALLLTEREAGGHYAASLLPGGPSLALHGFGLPGQPAEMLQDPYRGQWLLGDLRSGGLFRLSFEQGQGCLYPFSAGLQGSPLRLAWGPDGGLFLGACGLGPWRMRGGAGWGLEKLLYKGLSVFDLREVRARSNGFELEFTEPLQPGEGRDPAAYRIRQARA